MRDFVSCFSEYAVQISDNASCSSHSTASCVPPPITSAAAVPSVQVAVTSIYKSVLSDHRQILISITWSKSSSSSPHTLTISFNNDPSPSFKLAASAASSRLFKKLKGAKSFNLHTSKVEVSWDLSSAKYGPGPEPTDDDYHLFVSIDSEPVLTLGDPTRDPQPKPKFALVSRQEHFLGSAHYSTRARFRNGGEEHEISIRCDGGVKQQPALTVAVDEKVAIVVKRLQWNFRGNETIFLGGLLVDMMWDLREWFHCDESDDIRRNGVFMFKTRSGLDSRLWLDDEDKSDRDCVVDSKVEFTLMIYACKNNS